MMTELVLAQAALLAGPLQEQQMELLKVLCQAAVSSLEAQLRDGITVEDCRADFVAAASLFALAAIQEAVSGEGIEEFRAGDLTVRRKNMDVSSRCMQRQAEMIIQPFVKDRFMFVGV